MWDALLHCSDKESCRELLVQLQKALDRPPLEYSVQFWSPHNRNDVIEMNRMQGRFIVMLPGVEKFNHEITLDWMFSL